MPRSAAPRQWLAAVFDVTWQVAAKQGFRSAPDWYLAKDGVHCAPFAQKGAMNSPTPDAHVFRFGVFELDVRSGELRRHGLKIRLPDQSFQILRALLLRPGELVTRDELRQLLWTADTFVDFEVGLNSAVRKLREALDDSADNPRFVETVPRHGYRFVGARRRFGAAGGLRGNVRSSLPPVQAVRRDNRLAGRASARACADQPSLASASLACGGAPVRPACRDGGSCLPRRAAQASGRRNGRSADPVPRGAPVREPDGRPCAGLLRRQRDRCGHGASRPGRGRRRDLTNVGAAIQTDGQAAAADPDGAGQCRRRRGGHRAEVRRHRPDHGETDSCGDRSQSLGAYIRRRHEQDVRPAATDRVRCGRRGRAAPADCTARTDHQSEGVRGIPQRRSARGVCSDTKDSAGPWGISRKRSPSSPTLLQRTPSSRWCRCNSCSAVPTRRTRSFRRRKRRRARRCSSTTTFPGRTGRWARSSTCITGVGRKATRHWSGPRSWAVR